MTEDSQLFILIGNPVAHSLSPLMHNAAFRKMKMDAHYRAVRVDTAREAIRAIRQLHVQGASITLPHKTSMIEYLDEMSDNVRKIGAVNTVTHVHGTLIGENTDWTGLVRALEGSIVIEGNTFAIVGAGGAARAAVYGILQRKGIPVILSRTAHTGEALANEFGCDFFPLNEITRVQAHCLINTTPVGMAPHIDVSPVPAEALSNFTWVMDMIYNPLRTRLLTDAESTGCGIISGLAMFVSQGAEQIQIWTGRTPPFEYMMDITTRELNNEGN
jgi:shikimate dehydrogenase